MNNDKKPGDGGEFESALKRLKECAAGWVPDVCLVGNITASEISEICTHATELLKATETLRLEARQWKEAFDRSCDDIATLKAEIDALRKQVPKTVKPEMREINPYDGLPMMYWECPVCKRDVSGEDVCDCGARLDWSEEGGAK